MRLRLYIYRRRVRVTVCIVLLCGAIPCSPSMYNAYPKLCYMFVLPSDTAALALEYFIWLRIRPISARFMTSGVGLFHRVPGRGSTIDERCV